MSVLCVYRPPTGSIDQLVDFLNDFLSQVPITKTETWILGDFNVNYLVRNHPDIVP